MMRYRTVIGRQLCARPLATQKAKAAAGCKILNVMTRLGMPVSQHIARAPSSGGEPGPHLISGPKPRVACFACRRSPDITRAIAPNR
jgi:hypothetical protein